MTFTNDMGAGPLRFAAESMLPQLDAANYGALDLLPFGVIRMTGDGIVVAYNECESRMAGLSLQSVLGRHFFTEIAPCTNNALVAGRFKAEPTLDATIDYVFSLRLKPMPVRLRMLQGSESRFAYLLVAKR